jgi:aspartate-semialdehyde dehydrogenase
MKKLNIALVGATGMVGRNFMKVLEERDGKNINVNRIVLLASARSKGKILQYKGTDVVVEELTDKAFDGIDIALFGAGGDISKEYCPIAVKSGAVAVDNSSVWRMDETVPLVVPEVNPDDVSWHKGIIANPNCSTIQAVVALAPLMKFGIKRIVYSTYQSVSGAGMGGMDDLQNGLNGEKPKKFAHQIANNVIPHIDSFTENGYTKEELKMIGETQKILHAPNIRITATTVRVPVFIGHSESVNVEFDKPFELDEIRAALAGAKGIVMVDDPAKNKYPMPIDAEGRDEVFVGRLRRDFSVDNGINMWVVADNARKGAATNAVQIAELL